MFESIVGDKWAYRIVLCLLILWMLLAIWTLLKLSAMCLGPGFMCYTCDIAEPGFRCVNGTAPWNVKLVHAIEGGLR